MDLSIREASRFIIGAAMMRDKAIEASGHAGITLDNVALAALRADGQQLRQAIEALADQEAGWLRNTPPHVLTTPRVMQSREAEVRTFTAIHAAVVTALEQGDLAAQGQEAARRALREALVAAVRAIDETPGSAQERRQLLASLKEQVIATGHPEFMAREVHAADVEWARRLSEKRLRAYRPVERSDDYDDDPDRF